MTVRESPADTAEDTRSHWGMSLAFWLCLLTSVTVYAGVALAPPLWTHFELRRRYFDNQVELVGLEQRTRYLQRVNMALREDPQFAAELARVELDAAGPDEERIAVDPEHSLDALPPAPELPEPVNAVPWYAPAVRRLAEDSGLRSSLALAAAGLVLFAFTFLHDAHAEHFRSAFGFVRRTCSRVVGRYRG